MAQLKYVREDIADATQASVIASVIADRGSLPDICALMAHSPQGLVAYEGFSRFVRTSTSIDNRLREIIILRTVQLLGIDYEWKRHLQLAAAAGVSDELIADLASWGTSSLVDARTAAALRFVDRTATGADSQAAGEELMKFSPTEAVDIALVVGFYRLVPVVVTAFNIAADDRLPPAHICMTGVD
ncbi:carboxymuconolactone decarboxylase family protein [Arthrobacter sp. KNU40]|uniref:carboxymuconolactone decarboxylase family protein n=1 Tax=Arthrobacter sp. KNU40 TaxID=3447965 RepID=UPI003F613EEE